MSNKPTNQIPNFVLVGGAQRSGTTLVQKILGLHSQVVGGPEFDSLNKIAQLYKDMRWAERAGRHTFYYTKDELKQHFAHFIGDLFSKNLTSDTIYISEKTPANALHFKNLRTMLPNARFLFVVRDPRAVLYSQIQVKERAKKENIELKLKQTLAGMVINIHHYLKQASRFKDKENTKVVFYEDLVTDPESSIRAICSFLSIPFETEMLDTRQTNAISEFKGKENITKKAWYSKHDYDKAISNTSVVKWQQSLSAYQISFINKFFRVHRLDITERYSFDKGNILTEFVVSIALFGTHFIQQLKKGLRWLNRYLESRL